MVPASLLTANGVAFWPGWAGDPAEPGGGPADGVSPLRAVVAAPGSGKVTAALVVPGPPLIWPGTTLAGRSHGDDAGNNRFAGRSRNMTALAARGIPQVVRPPRPGS